jgi:hypothetical protein
MKAKEIDTRDPAAILLAMVGVISKDEFLDGMIQRYRDGGWSLEEALEDGRRKMNKYPPLPEDVQEANSAYFKARWEETSE